ncbi:MAG: hypothetical protein Q8T08_01355 [Ignavibacteria bacterium]|nr:hypothetical protein [Ignavibacteria bacterium]
MMSRFNLFQVCERTARSRFDHYHHLLHSIKDQANYLRELNNQLSEEYKVPDVWFEDFDTTSNHHQTFEDLEFVYIVPSKNIKKLFMFQFEIMKQVQPNTGIGLCRGLELSGMRFDECADLDLFKNPGIYKRRINLVNNWNSEPAGVSLDNYSDSRCDGPQKKELWQIREYAKQNGFKLAGLPAIAACLVQDKSLLRFMDSVFLPQICAPELLADGLTSYHHIVFSVEIRGNQVMLNAQPDFELPSRNKYCMPIFID